MLDNDREIHVAAIPHQTGVTSWTSGFGEIRADPSKAEFIGAESPVALTVEAGPMYVNATLV